MDVTAPKKVMLTFTTQWLNIYLLYNTIQIRQAEMSNFTNFDSLRPIFIQSVGGAGLFEKKAVFAD